MKSYRSFSYLLILLAITITLIMLFFDVNTAARFINGLIMIAIPLLLGIFLISRFDTKWRIWGIGALTFICSQVLHIPFNKWLLEPLMDWFGLQPEPNSMSLAVIGLLAGLSAGFFEETARLVVYKRWLLKARSWKEGVLFGAGHGGCEAILLGLLVLAGFFQMVALREATPESLSRLVSPDQVEATLTSIQAYWTTPWYESMLGSLERVSAIIIQISLAVLVLQVNRRGKSIYYWLAVLWHTIVDMTGVYGVYSWGMYIMEAVVMGLALISLGIIFALRTNDPPPETIAEPMPPDELKSMPTPPDVTPEKIDKSRYI